MGVILDKYKAYVLLNRMKSDMLEFNGNVILKSHLTDHDKSILAAATNVLHNIKIADPTR